MSTANIEELQKINLMMDAKITGLESFIEFFISKYPNYPLSEIPLERLESHYIENYHLNFLASYIRYSDISLLKSGLNDEEIKEKLCFLHQHLGTILISYRQFIFSDDISLEDIKRWLPLLVQYQLKEKILTSKKINDHFKRILDECLNPNSYVYQNLLYMSQYFPQIEIADLPGLEDQQAFYYFLNIKKNTSESISSFTFMNCFEKLKVLLKSISKEELEQYRFMILQYMRNETILSSIHSKEELLEFYNKKQEENDQFLDEEQHLDLIKQRFSTLFLGMPYRQFKSIFPHISPTTEPQYQLLKNFYETRFPLLLKEQLYDEFMSFPYLKTYLEEANSKCNMLSSLKFRNSMTKVKEDAEFLQLSGEKFTFITMPLSDFQEQYIKEQSQYINASVQSDEQFQYEREQSFLAFSNPEIVSYYSDETCIIKGKNLNPLCIITYDQVNFMDITLKRFLQIPIVVIDTESYARMGYEEMMKLYERRNWEAYFNKKQSLVKSLEKHPWLLNRYFNVESLYEDVHDWIEQINQWMLEKLPTEFLKYQIEILKKLIEFNEEIVQKIMKFNISEQEKVLEYRIMMKKYQELI